MPVRPILVIASLSLLAGCGGEPSDNGARSATGKVLEGTISDDMLPLDTVRSQPPLAEPEAAARASAAATDAAVDEEASAAPADGDAAAGAEATPQASDD